MDSSIKLLSASLLTLGLLYAQHPFGPPTPVTGAPFSATKTDTRQQTLADGNQISETHTEKLYRDADGRTRMESTRTTPSGEVRTMIAIFDPVAGFIANLNPTDSTATKQTLHTPPSGTPPAHSAPANAPAVVKTDLGTQTIAGLAATGTSTTRTIPAGTMGNTQAIVETREVWISTALKIPVKMTSTDPQHGNSSMLVSNVTQGAQDPSLFVIPSGYTVKDAPAGPGRHGMGPGGPGAGGPPPFAQQ